MQKLVTIMVSSEIVVLSMSNEWIQYQNFWITKSAKQNLQYSGARLITINLNHGHHIKTISKQMKHCVGNYRIFCNINSFKNVYSVSCRSFISFISAILFQCLLLFTHFKLFTNTPYLPSVTWLYMYVKWQLIHFEPFEKHPIFSNTWWKLGCGITKLASK